MKFLYFLVFLAGCTQSANVGCKVVSSDIKALIEDSYRVRQSKESMLEFMGDEPYEPVNSVATADSKKVHVIGAVNKTVTAVGKLTLLDIMSDIDYSDVSLFHSYLLRDNKKCLIDLQRLIVKQDISKNVLLQDGDKLYISPGNVAQVSVTGAVKRPHVLTLPHGFMPIVQVLAQARGFSDKANFDEIQIIRSVNKQMKRYVFGLEHILSLPEDSILVIPGDVIYVSEK